MSRSEFPRWGETHPTTDCTEFMRRTLGEDLHDLYNEAPRRAGWRAVTRDAGTPFPSAASIRAENWGAWLDAALVQVDNAAPSQIAAYYREKYEECPVCGASWTKRRSRR